MLLDNDLQSLWSNDRQCSNYQSRDSHRNQRRLPLVLAVGYKNQHLNHSFLGEVFFLSENHDSAVGIAATHVLIWMAEYGSAIGPIP
mmetsp:Transcript_8779/g.13268  ORF Transcript_8779/g.13268 Transcript_8779/m.13268 type:complete len:87 (-) Transcript_8779:77-337(-)